MFVLYYLMILVQSLAAMIQIFDNLFLTLLLFLPFLFDACTFVLISLTHHGELLINVVDALFYLRFLRKQVLLCIAVSDDGGALIVYLRQQFLKHLQCFAVLLQQVYVNAFSGQFCFLLFVKLSFLTDKLLIAKRGLCLLRFLELPQFLIEQF